MTHTITIDQPRGDHHMTLTLTRDGGCRVRTHRGGRTLEELHTSAPEARAARLFRLAEHSDLTSTPPGEGPIHVELRDDARGVLRRDLDPQSLSPELLALTQSAQILADDMRFQRQERSRRQARSSDEASVLGWSLVGGAGVAVAQFMIAILGVMALGALTGASASLASSHGQLLLGLGGLASYTMGGMLVASQLERGGQIGAFGAGAVASVSTATTVALFTGSIAQALSALLVGAVMTSLSGLGGWLVLDGDERARA